MDTYSELELRERFQDAIAELSPNGAFLAIIEYLEFIYRSKLEEFEYDTSRSALIDTGHKRCLKVLIEDIKQNMNESIVIDTKW
jgi:hypothetical protein